MCEEQFIFHLWFMFKIMWGIGLRLKGAESRNKQGAIFHYKWFNSVDNFYIMLCLA